MRCVVLLASVASLCGCMDQVNDQVAKDLEEQYRIAERQGDKIQICVQAGIVAAGYLQAKNEAKYQEWKARERSDCNAAGVPKP